MHTGVVDSVTVTAAGPAEAGYRLPVHTDGLAVPGCRPPHLANFSYRIMATFQGSQQAIQHLAKYMLAFIYQTLYSSTMKHRETYE